MTLSLYHTHCSCWHVQFGLLDISCFPELQHLKETSPDSSLIELSPLVQTLIIAVHGNILASSITCWGNFNRCWFQSAAVHSVASTCMNVVMRNYWHYMGFVDAMLFPRRPLALFSLQQTQALRLRVSWHHQYLLTCTWHALLSHRWWNHKGQLGKKEEKCSKRG